MNLHELDLNLLTALSALLAERSVTKAAIRTGITQPAMSHALARLRALMGDPLLVRTRTGMQPTPRALEVIEPLDRALAELGRVVARRAPFDPALATDRFRISTNDFLGLVLFPKLLAAVWTQAPGVVVALRSMTGFGIEDLDEDRVDLVVNIAPPRGQGAGIKVQKLFAEKFVCVVREDHPTVAKRLSLEAFVALPHALVSPRGDRGGVVDAALAKLGRKRHIAVTVPHFLVAPLIVRETDVVLTLPERVARSMAGTGLRIVAPPGELGLKGFESALLWHERRHADPAHAWLRSLIAKTAKAI